MEMKFDFWSLWFGRVAGMLIELQTLLVNRSILSKAQLLAADINQLTSVFSQSNPGDGKRHQRCTELKGLKTWQG